MSGFFKKGYWVIAPDGRAGLISEVSVVTPSVEVQFGADGPFDIFHHDSLRYALPQEIKDRDLYGTPGKFWVHTLEAE